MLSLVNVKANPELLAMRTLPTDDHLTDQDIARLRDPALSTDTAIKRKNTLLYRVSVVATLFSTLLNIDTISSRALNGNVHVSMAGVLASIPNINQIRSASKWYDPTKAYKVTEVRQLASGFAPLLDGILAEVVTQGAGETFEDMVQQCCSWSMAGEDPRVLRRKLTAAAMQSYPTIGKFIEGMRSFQLPQSCETNSYTIEQNHELRRVQAMLDYSPVQEDTRSKIFHYPKMSEIHLGGLEQTHNERLAMNLLIELIRYYSNTN